ncbi:MAG: cardiolipin synthase [Sphingomicrobium sp.]
MIQLITHPLTLLLLAVELVVLGRAMLRPNREPTSRLAWVIVIIVLPVVGIVAYLLLGEARVSRSRRERGRTIDASLPLPACDEEAAGFLADSTYAAPFALARTVNRLGPTGGNRATLAADSNAAIDQIVADMDAARDHVHACFYIWLADTNGLKIRDALIRAADRGVTVRVLADALGSRLLIRSAHWRAMTDAGVELKVALPVGNLLWTMTRGRVDLRNHRKLVVVDNIIAWCGSQNAADPEFKIKPHYAPWVDLMARFVGPVARHWQFLFISDWMGEGGEDLSSMLTGPAPAADGPILAQVIGTGPTLPYAAMTACFAELVHSARTELVVTTPYFVPDEQLLYSLLSAARRGVIVRLLLPERNDSRIVAAASRSLYRDLLDAGVELYEYRLGLLHAKTMVADGTIALIGSANLDRRSFELNFENNILFHDPSFAAAVRARQDEWLADCRRVTMAHVDRFGLFERLWQNFLAMFGPLL